MEQAFVNMPEQQQLLKKRIARLLVDGMFHQVFIHGFSMVTLIRQLNHFTR